MSPDLFESYELRRIARRLGAILVLAGGLVLILQAYLFDVLPPTGGFIDTTATVSHLERKGTFQDPAFLVTLTYSIIDANQQSQEMRSGRRVAYEDYRSLSIGDRVQIHYNPNDPFEWRLILPENELSEYGLGLLMVVFAAFSLSFPVILGWASRQKDFDYTDELDDAQALGVTNPPYGDSRQSP
jgi:Protein of unknown function (DUF3592)